MNPISKKFHLIHLTIFLFLHFTSSIPITTPIFCGKIQIKPPFLDSPKLQSPPSTDPVHRLLSRMLLCKTHTLYLRTSIGLFQVTSIDYNSKLLTLSSHPPLHSSQTFIPPSLLSGGFAFPPQPNSLILVNCSDVSPERFPVVQNCKIKGSSCVLMEDSEKLEVGFDPKDLNCSHYMRVYRKALVEHGEGDGDHIAPDGSDYEVGTKMSFEIPDHVPNICEECEKPHGNCGVGLRCICHAKECRDKIVNEGRVFMNQPPVGIIILTVIIAYRMASAFTIFHG